MTDYPPQVKVQYLREKEENKKMNHGRPKERSKQDLTKKEVDRPSENSPVSNNRGNTNTTIKPQTVNNTGTSSKVTLVT